MTKSELLASIKYKKAEYEIKLDSLSKGLLNKQKMQMELDRLVPLKDDNTNISYACKLLLEKLVNTSKSQLENFLTFAINQIFPNREYSIELILKKDSKQPALELTLVESGVKQNIKDSVGGGILHTLGLLLQIYYIEVYKLNKVMFIDEGLKAVSSNSTFDGKGISYLENVLNFLKYLSKERGYTFVLVTHEDKVREYADKTYIVERGKVKLWE